MSFSHFLSYPVDRVDPGISTLARLDSQICWYDVEASRNNLGDKLSKLVGIIAAALVPVVTVASASPWLGAGLAAVAVIAQAMQELFQFQRNWITFAAAREALKRERYLYLARAGDYSSKSQSSPGLLAVRVERIISQETSTWAASLDREST